MYTLSDLPIRILLMTEALGLVVSVGLGTLVLRASLFGEVDAPGYAPTVLSIMFFTFLNLLGLGIIGSYVSRTFENTKRRPGAIVMTRKRFDPNCNER